MAFIRKEGKFYKVYFQYSNKKYKRSTKTTSKQIAEDIRKKIENEIAMGLFRIENYSIHQQKPLKEFFKEALDYSKTNKAPRTVQREELIYRNFLNYCNDVPLSNIKVKLIESYKAYLQVEKGFASSGINIELRHLSSAFSLAVKYGYLISNPFKQVNKVQTPKKKPKFLTLKQAEELLSLTKEKSIYQYIFIALNTGARISEVCNLKWKDVDLENHIIHIHGKGSKERTVPIPKQLFEFLKDRDKSEVFVVTGSQNISNVTRNFRKYADRLKFYDITFHNLRDTYASWLVQNGLNIKIIQELLGHDSIQTTLIYAHLAPDSKLKVIEIFNQQLKLDQTHHNE